MQKKLIITMFIITNLLEANEIDVSGYATYRYNDKKEIENGSQSSEQENIYKLGLGLNKDINEDVSLQINAFSRKKFEDTQSDENIPFQVEHINFNYFGFENFSLKLGKLPIDTPWTYAKSNILVTNSGSGVAANYSLPYITFLSSYFSNTNINKQEGSKTNLTSNSFSTFAVILPIMEETTAQFWYGNIDKAKDSNFPEGGKAFNLAFDTLLYKDLGLNFSHTTLKSNEKDEHTNSLTKIGISKKIDKLQLSTQYIKTGKNGGFVALHTEADGGFKG